MIGPSPEYATDPFWIVAYIFIQPVFEGSFCVAVWVNVLFSPPRLNTRLSAAVALPNVTCALAPFFDTFAVMSPPSVIVFAPVPLDWNVSG